MERKKKPFRDSRESRKPRTSQEPRELPDDVLVGRNAVTEALKSGRGINKILLAQGDRAHDIEELLALAKERGVLTQTVERAKIESLAGGHRHQGVLAFVAPVPYVEVEDILARAGIAHVVEPDIRYRMWAKFMLNVGINQTCCAFGATYGEVYADKTSELWRTFISAMREVVAVAQAEGVALTEQELSSYAALEETLDPSSTPSMGQDRINHHRTEVDEFSGEVMRRAQKHGILVPVNAFLNKRIREIEAAY